MAAVNLIHEVAYGNISVIRRLPLQDTNVQLYPYGITGPLPLIGIFQTVVKFGDEKVSANFYVVRGKYGNLLSCLTTQQLKLVVLSDQVLSVNTDDPPAVSAMLNEYKDVLSGIGKLKDAIIKIHVNKDVHPATQSYRRIPLTLREKLEAKLAE